MRHPATLPAFSPSQYTLAHRQLAARVAVMMGRKLEEGDWSHVYCAAKGLQQANWSNLNIDIVYNNVGVEHKMLRVDSAVPIKHFCGTTLMHPAATRSIRVSATAGDATEIARDVLTQYSELIAQRQERIEKNAPGMAADLRTGWLLWQQTLQEFLYFEQEMLSPNPGDYWAEWKASGGGSRKTSRNLWVYEQATGQKRYSITTGAGAKIQPYFDVPPPDDPNLYYFRVQGEELGDSLVRMWVTPTTALLLAQLLGALDTDTISNAILDRADALAALRSTEVGCQMSLDRAEQIIVTKSAYMALSAALNAVSDEHMMQLLAQHLSP